VAFAPLPVFLRGGENYQRLEPDFIVIKDGVFAVVEVDGDSFHPETPSAARTRLKLLEDAGAFILRVNANVCSTPEFAEACAEGILKDIATHKNNRR
jgi:very-short-patch-repair endonuclease